MAQGWKAGSPDSESFLTPELHDRMTRIGEAACRAVSPDRNIWEDVIQETFLAFWKSAYTTAELPPEEQAAWFFRVAHRQAIEAVRKRSRWDRGDATATDPTVFPHVEDVEVQASGHELDRLLADALPDLSDRQREVFKLRVMEGLSERETADQIGVSSGTIKKHSSRARAKLQAYLEDRGYTT